LHENKSRVGTNFSNQRKQREKLQCLNRFGSNHEDVKAANFLQLLEVTISYKFDSVKLQLQFGELTGSWLRETPQTKDKRDKN
jgi:hypothetical protein